MNHVEKIMLVPYPREQMFHLVDRVEHYPEFLPWCGKSEVLKREGEVLEARVYIDYMKIHQNFSTRNFNREPERIDITFLDGPFKILRGTWHFDEIGAGACKIRFALDYEFSNVVVSRLIGSVFSYISGSLVQSFVREAKRRYG